MTASIHLRIRSVLEHLRLSIGDLKDQDPLTLDSLTVVRIHDGLEEEFAIRIRARDVLPENFESIEALARLVQSYLEHAP